MIFTLFGVYLIVDGVVSLYVFRKQPWYWQAVRLVRTLIGISQFFPASQVLRTPFGIYLLVDAFVSYAVFRGQDWYCQAVRSGRGLIGIILLFLGT